MFNRGKVRNVKRVLSCLPLLLAFSCLSRVQGVPAGTQPTVKLTWAAPSPIGGSGVIATILSLLPGPPQTATTTFNGVVVDLTGTPIASGEADFTLKPGVDSTVSGNARFTPTTIPCVIANPNLTGGHGTDTPLFTVDTPQNWQPGDSVIFVGTSDAGLNNSSVASPFVILGRLSSVSFTISYPGGHNFSAGGTVGGIYASGGTGPCNVVQNTALNPAGTSYSVGIQSAGAPVSSFNVYAIGAGPIDLSTVIPTPSQQPAYSFVDQFSNQNIFGIKNFTNAANTYSGGTFTNPILNNATFNGTTASNWTLYFPVIYAPVFNQANPITLAGTFNYSIVWNTPAAPRSLTIGDPGGTDSFTYLLANQALQNKTLGPGTLIQNTFKAGNFGIYTATGETGFPVQVAQVAGGSLTASIPLTTLYAFPASGRQFMAVHYQLVTTSGAGSGTVTATFTWTDCNGTTAITKTSASLSLATTALEVDGTISACVANGGIAPVTYLTTDSSPGTGSYAFRAWLDAE